MFMHVFNVINGISLIFIVVNIHELIILLLQYTNEPECSRSYALTRDILVSIGVLGRLCVSIIKNCICTSIT